MEAHLLPLEEEVGNLFVVVGGTCALRPISSGRNPRHAGEILHQSLDSAGKVGRPPGHRSSAHPGADGTLSADQMIQSPQIGDKNQSRRALVGFASTRLTAHTDGRLDLAYGCLVLVSHQLLSLGHHTEFS